MEINIPNTLNTTQNIRNLKLIDSSGIDASSESSCAFIEQFRHTHTNTRPTQQPTKKKNVKTIKI